MCFSKALVRHCVTAIFVLFLFVLLHVCYICTTVSHQANSALKVFLFLFCFVTLALNFGCVR